MTDSRTYQLTANQLILLLQIYRGRSDNDKPADPVTFQSDMRLLPALGLIRVFGSEAETTSEGTTLVRRMLCMSRIEGEEKAAEPVKQTPGLFTSGDITVVLDSITAVVANGDFAVAGARSGNIQQADVPAFLESFRKHHAPKNTTEVRINMGERFTVADERTVAAAFPGTLYPVAVECLRDVISHASNLRSGLQILLACAANNPTNDSTDRANEADYWRHELAVLERMVEQAESALTRFRGASNASPV